MRVRRNTFLFNIMLVLMLSGSVYASGFSIYGFGARAIGMGGAFVAGARDPSAVFYNPAGISNLTGTHVMLGTNLTNNRSLFDHYIAITGWPSSTIMNDKWMVTPIFYLSSAINTRINVGFGLYSPFGLKVDWGENWPGKEFAIETNLMTFCYNPVISYRVNDRLNVAVGYQYVKGSYDLRKFDDNLFAGVMADVDGSGSGFTAGVQYMVNETTALGLAYRSGVKLDLSGSTSVSPAVVQSSNVTSKIELPASIAFGLHYFPREELGIELDVVWKGWSSINEIKFDAVNPLLNYLREKNFEDKIGFRIGFEYNASDIIMFRSGFFHDPSPVPDKYLDPSAPDTYSEGATLGTGLTRGRITADVAYIHVFKSEHFTDNTPFYFDGRYENKGDIFILSIGYKIF